MYWKLAPRHLIILILNLQRSYHISPTFSYAHIFLRHINQHLQSPHVKYVKLTYVTIFIDSLPLYFHQNQVLEPMILWKVWIIVPNDFSGANEP